MSGKYPPNDYNEPYVGEPLPLDNLDASGGMGMETCDELQARIAELEAERDRLKAALTGIALLEHANENTIWRAPHIARAALSDPSGEKT